MAARTRVIATCFGLLGLVGTVVYGVWPGTVLASAFLVVIALGSVSCLMLGQMIHRPRRPWPWRLTAAAGVTFLGGLVVRPVLVGRPEPFASAADVLTLTGYTLLITAFVAVLRTLGRLEHHALTDGMAIGLGSALLTTVLLVLPTAAIHSRPAALWIPETIYPVIDVVLLVLLLNLGFSTASRLPSFQMITLAIASLFVGDVSYAWLATSDQLTGPPVLNVPYLAAYTLFGMAAMHPSMVGLSTITSRRVQPWSAPRLVLIVAAGGSPLSLLLLVPHPTLADRIAIVVGGAGLLLATLTRALTAVRDHTRAGQVLEYQATHDALTGLPNRLLLVQQVQELLAAPHRPGAGAWLLYVDLDGFRLVNDHWGHDTGDQILIEMARRLVGLVTVDHILARVGGDEFVIAGHDCLDPAVLAEQVRQVLREPVVIAGRELVVTGSTGVALADPQATVESLMQDADTAMYRAKTAGRDRCTVFDQTIRASIRQRVETELALRHAIAHQQLRLAYQPQLDPRTELVIGAEALLRWTHPERGEISPGDFIPIAEETGLIGEIGTWVLQESARQLADWRAQALLPDAFTLAVNTSAPQYADGDFHLLIDETLRQHQVPADLVTVEITESVLMADADQVARILLRLRQLGLRLSVDDFGTGYSSLSYLSRFPVDEVKIDRSFIRGLGNDIGNETVVRAVVGMATALNFDIVAEGVETTQQRDIVTHLGIRRAQGWLWGKAVDPSTFQQHHLRPQTLVPAGRHH